MEIFSERPYRVPAGRMTRSADRGVMLLLPLYLLQYQFFVDGSVVLSFLDKLRMICISFKTKIHFCILPSSMVV